MPGLARKSLLEWHGLSIAIVVIQFTAWMYWTETAQAASTEKPSAPLFSKPGGIYTGKVSVQLNARNAQIRYSTDGTEPGTNSAVFNGTIELTNCAVVRAIAFYSDGRISEPVQQNYTLLAEDVASFSSNLPLVVVNSFGSEITSETKLPASLLIINTANGRAKLADAKALEHMAFLRVRGHSSLRYPKHSYSVKLVNGLHESQKVSLLGFPKESDWVLYGPYPDKTLLRDALAYDLSNAMGRWAAHWKFVEVFVSDSAAQISMSQYAGVYLLEEKVTRDKHRVDIPKLDTSTVAEPELTGGYIFKKDHAGASEKKKFGAEGPPQAGIVSDRAGYPTGPGSFPADPAGFLPSYKGKDGTAPVPSKPLRAAASAPKPIKKPKAKIDPAQPQTNYLGSALVVEQARLDDAAVLNPEEGFKTKLQRNQFYYYEPQPDEITPVQRAYLKDYLNQFEFALYGPNFTDPARGYRAFIDSDSFIDQHLLIEATKNVDGFRFSTFFYKDRGGKVIMGPAWDWNLSFGNASGKQGYMPEHWLWPQLDDTQYSWFRRLFDDPDFCQRYVDRWAQLRTNVFATSNIIARVDRMAAELKEAQARNFSRWEILGVDVAPNYFVGNSYSEEVEWMKDWVQKRFAWVDAQFVAAPQLKLGGQLELSSDAKDAKIYFTLNGTDPRASGGAIASSAQLFQTPLVAKNAKLFARVLAGKRWSAPLFISAK